MRTRGGSISEGVPKSRSALISGTLFPSEERVQYDDLCHTCVIATVGATEGDRTGPATDCCGIWHSHLLNHVKACQGPALGNRRRPLVFPFLLSRSYFSFLSPIPFPRGVHCFRGTPPPKRSTRVSTNSPTGSSPTRRRRGRNAPDELPHVPRFAPSLPHASDYAVLRIHSMPGHPLRHLSPCRGTRLLHVLVDTLCIFLFEYTHLATLAVTDVLVIHNRAARDALLASNFFIVTTTNQRGRRSDPCHAYRFPLVILPFFPFLSPDIPRSPRLVFPTTFHFCWFPMCKETASVRRLACFSDLAIRTRVDGNVRVISHALG